MPRSALFRYSVTCLLAGSFVLLTACKPSPGQSESSESDAAPAADTSAEVATTPHYRARIRRTSYGIPHIEANDIGSLSFGEGYAQAEDHLCTIADQVVKVRSERSRYFGAGQNNVHLHSDVAMKALDLYEKAATVLEDDYMFEALGGFAAGYNLYLEQTGADQVGGWCQGADWVKPISAHDLAAYQRSVITLLPRLAGMIATAVPPDAAASVTMDLDAALASAADFAEELGRNGSNGWALGSDWSESGKAMLVANPHYPWIGAYRFWEKHLVMPGTRETYGVSLIGTPGVTIGFNEYVGWTHTVSAGKRMTFYALQLVPGQPTQYLYDGQILQMGSRDIEVVVRQEDGSLATQTITTWTSLHGPVLNFPNVGWNLQAVLAVRDANEANFEAMPQWVMMGQSANMDELRAAHEKYQGMPWVNTIAASSEGRAWYTDSAATPKLSPEAIKNWMNLQESDKLIGGMAQRGVVILPGHNSEFAWQDSDTARDPGLVPNSGMPQLERRDFVFNANDSFWLANSAQPIEGEYSPLHGLQRTARSLRTRNNDLTLSRQSPDDPAGENGLFSREEMKAALMSNRSYAAELLKPDLLAACANKAMVEVDGTSVDLAPACDVLAAWDNRFDADSRGAVLFREWIGQYPPAAFRKQGDLFAVDFDAADPINTPATLANSDLALHNLAAAVQLLTAASHALDVPLGELQYAITKLPERIAVHGGEGGYEGIMNMQIRSGNNTTLEALDLPPAIEGSRRLTAEGYPIGHGSSFVMALEFTDDGPVADAILSYSQSGDPSSEHFRDQTRLFADKQWRPVRFREADIAADTQREYWVER